MSSPRLLTLTFLMFVATIPVSAQKPAQTSSPSPSPTPQKPSPLEPDAYKLLEDIAKRIPGLRSRANRMQVSCDVADLIWERDEKRARELFEDVTKDFSELVASQDFSTANAANEFSIFYQQRQQLVERIANHDPAMALAFLRATRTVANPRMGYDQSNERNLETHLASLIAARDPVFALKLARESMKRGVTYNLVNVLIRLHQKDPAAAQTFYQELVDRIGADDMAHNQEALNTASNLLMSFSPPQANEQVHKQLVETLLTRALAISPGDSSRVMLAQNIYYQMRNLMAQIQKYAPARAAGLEQWTRGVERTFDANSRRYHEINELSQKATVDEIIAAASRFPEEMRPQLHHQAIWKALQGGDAERARSLVNELITDPSQKSQMLSQIEYQLFWKAVSESKVADARRLMNSVKDIDQRIQLIGQLVANLISTGDKAGALSLLDEARAAITDVPAGASKLNAQIQLARSYVEVDPVQSANLLQIAILQVNQLVAAASVLDGFENRYLSEGEWLPLGYTSLSNLVTNLQQSLALYAARTRQLEAAQIEEEARKRFANANHLAEQIERPEIQMQTQLQMARAVLKQTASRQPMNVVTGRRVFSVH